MTQTQTSTPTTRDDKRDKLVNRLIRQPLSVIRAKPFTGFGGFPKDIVKG